MESLDLTLFFSSPSLLIPDKGLIDSVEKGLLPRVDATHKFCNGELTPSEFLDYIHECGYDVSDFLDTVEDRLLLFQKSGSFHL